MLHFLPGPLLGALSFSLMLANTVLWNIPFYLLAFFKVILPFARCQALIARILIVLAECWIGCNNAILDLTQKTDWDIELPDSLSKNEWYLVLSNHRSWTDILALQRAFNRKIPFLKFFLKQELIWVPILGVSWWALDYPFMKRYSREHLARHPGDKGKDWETTRRKCERFKDKPISILNFIEGTRFTPAKKGKSQSPYRNLLSPKSGGVGFTMACMGPLFSAVIDVTVAYPDCPNPSFWALLSGKIPKVALRARRREVPRHLLAGSYMADKALQLQFHEWTADLWKEKDRQLDALLTPASPPRR